MHEVYYSNDQQRRIGRVLPDIVRARGLMWDLFSKDLRARYRNAVMGFVWAVLQPLLMMLILYLVFGVIFAERIGAADQKHPYAVTLLCGLIFWQYFASCVSRATTSILDNADLVKKVYFPREVIPLSTLGNCTVNLLIGFIVLLIFHLATGGGLGMGVVWMVPVFAVQVTLVVGVALLCSSLNIYFRDVGYMVDVGLTFGFYATPIFYSLDIVRERAANSPGLLSVYMLNPMVGIVTAYREALLDNRLPNAATLGWPALCAIAALALGAAVFRHNSPTLADHL